MKQRFIRKINSLLLTVSIALLISPTANAEDNPTTAATNWTPVLVSTYGTPSPFQGSENQWHLVYNALLTNYNMKPATITKFEILGRKSNGEYQVIKTLSQDELKMRFTPFAQKRNGNTLGAGQVGVVWVNLAFDKAESVPDELIHRVVFDAVAQTGTKKTYDYRVAKTKVDTTPPVRISPPLRGGKWVASGGYSGKLGHRKALFAIDNKLQAAQTYAIDWLRLDNKNYSCHDAYKPEGYCAYDEPVYAVADGTVLGVVDRFKDQVPQKAGGEDRLYWAGGNSIVIDLGNSNYAFYAHLKPGSIKVKEGDKVARGEIIAHVGNTGNTSEPHLHMHVTSDPGILNAHGVPYVFDEFEVTGEVKNFDTFFVDGIARKPQTIADSPFKGIHHDELPREGTVINFAQR